MEQTEGMAVIANDELLVTRETWNGHMVGVPLGGARRGRGGKSTGLAWIIPARIIMTLLPPPVSSSGLL